MTTARHVSHAPRPGWSAALALACALVGAVPAAGLAQEVPAWQKLLRWVSGPTRETSVPTTMMDRHMQLSRKTAPRPGDAQQAATIVSDARHVLARYANVADAERDGYLAFGATGTMGEEVHYISVRHSGMEARRPDWTQPGALLYRRTPAGMQAVGVMMTAPNDADGAELDRRAPRSIAVWHRHVDFCGEPAGTPRSETEGPTARFGLHGSIHTEAACKAAGGYWIPVAFGWMTHVYPNETDPARVWGGEHMDPAGASPGRHGEQHGRQHQQHGERAHGRHRH